MKEMYDYGYEEPEPNILNIIFLGFLFFIYWTSHMLKKIFKPKTP